MGRATLRGDVDHVNFRQSILIRSPLRLVGAAPSRAGLTTGWAESRLHVPAELPRVGNCILCPRCLSTWFVIERTRLGAYLRAATENPTLVRAFGINVPTMIAFSFRSLSK